ncbi:hypothetical protein PUN71_011025 [Arthrobacter sp. NQ7]|uniref:hypothetical protein n=1 Tax=Arthrobacter sp. NQ7 TaxID=3032303 RepID=UPI0024101471|nr:hypothetical protein [Arthrobacter sp. NQ7]MDJ0457735.1 hypothetical protein [Arthrobacter sp. NQ7]
MASRNRGRSHRHSGSRTSKVPTQKIDTLAALAQADPIFSHVLDGISLFTSHAPSTRDRLPAIISAEIQWLCKTRHYASNDARRCLDFWAALDKTYGREGRIVPESIAALLDAWQLWLRGTSELAEAELSAMSLRWLEEFASSGIGWRPAREELFSFRMERIRNAAQHFLRTHQRKFPNIVHIADIRPLQEGQKRMQKRPKQIPRICGQPVAHVGREFVSVADEFMGNREDYWPYPINR